MLPINRQLSQRSRFVRGDLARTGVRLEEVAILVSCGLGAAAMSALVDFSMRIPGHAILRVVLPLSLGIALVPRRGAGVTMGASAVFGLVGMLFAGVRGMGPGATTSLLLLGPLLDVAALRARPGWRLYAAFGAAGLAANLGAFVVRGVAKMASGAAAGLRPLQDWLSIAPLSYALSGLLAGLIGAAIWFRAGDCSSRPSADGS